MKKFNSKERKMFFVLLCIACAHGSAAWQPVTNYNTAAATGGTLECAVLNNNEAVVFRGSFDLQTGAANIGAMPATIVNTLPLACLPPPNVDSSARTLRFTTSGQTTARDTCVIVLEISSANYLRVIGIACAVSQGFPNRMTCTSGQPCLRRISMDGVSFAL